VGSGITAILRLAVIPYNSSEGGNGVSFWRKLASMFISEIANRVMNPKKKITYYVLEVLELALRMALRVISQPTIIPNT
jgi:hypothetical protein